MLEAKQGIDVRQQLIPHFKAVSRSWETMKEQKALYARNLNIEYFVRRHPNEIQIFLSRISRQASQDTLKRSSRDFLNEHIIIKHGIAVTNFVEAVVEFINGNEDSKPVLYTLGRSHKDCNVTEKMFLEMKSALIEVLKPDMGKDVWKSWEVTLDHILLNYVFKGMQMKVPLNMELK